MAEWRAGNTDSVRGHPIYEGDEVIARAETVAVRDQIVSDHNRVERYKQALREIAAEPRNMLANVSFKDLREVAQRALEDPA